MDRNRLKEVQQSDLTESKVNEDFVDWLKTKGPTWILVGLVAICAYLGTIRFKQSRVQKVENAWAAFSQAQLPGALEDVAAEHGDVGHIASFAWLNAGDALLQSVQSGTVLGSATGPTGTGDPLTPDLRAEYLDRAAGLYQRAADSDDGSVDMTLYGVGALNGLATVAECRQNPDVAVEWYEKAAARAGDRYPGLAEDSMRRAENARRLDRTITFPSQAEMPAIQGELETRSSVDVDETIAELLAPEDDTDDE